MIGDLEIKLFTLLLHNKCVIWGFQVERCDFEMAQRSIVPSSHRVAPGFGRKLPKFLEPLLANTVDGLTARVRSVFHCGFVKGNKR